MYNQEIKNKFIEECAVYESSAKRAKRLFKLSERFETELGKDLCAMTDEELVGPVECIVGVRLGTQKVDMSVLKRYANWCIENGVDGACDALTRATGIDPDRMKESSFSGPEHLNQKLNEVFSPVGDGKPDNLCRGYLWLAFFGVDEADSVRIEDGHIDLRNRVIRFEGREYPIYEQADVVIRYLCAANSFFYDFKRREVVIFRAEGRKILRGTGDSPTPNADSMRRMTNRRLAAMPSNDGSRLKYQGVRLSGVLYRMYLEEKESGTYNIDHAVRDYYHDIDSLPAGRITVKKNELATDYERWKIAFNM